MFHHVPSQAIGHSFLCCIAGPHWLNFTGVSLASSYREKNQHGNLNWKDENSNSNCLFVLIYGAALSFPISLSPFFCCFYVFFHAVLIKIKNNSECSVRLCGRGHLGKESTQISFPHLANAFSRKVLKPAGIPLDKPIPMPFKGSLWSFLMNTHT